MIKINKNEFGKDSTFSVILRETEYAISVIAYYFDHKVHSKPVFVLPKSLSNFQNIYNDLKEGVITSGTPASANVDMSDENWQLLEQHLLSEKLKNKDEKDKEEKYGFKKGQKVYVNNDVVNGKYKHFLKDGKFEGEVVAFFGRHRSDGTEEKFCGVAYNREFITTPGGKTKNKNLQWVKPEFLSLVNKEDNTDIEMPILSEKEIEEVQKTINALKSGAKKCKSYSSSFEIYDDIDYDGEDYETEQ